MSLERLHKYMAACGVGSRRRCEEYIREGLVKVNGKVVTEMGSKVDPAKDSVKFQGRLLRAPAGPFVYLMMNKPLGVVTTLSDEKGRPTVTDVLGRGVKERVYPVGRLDVNSSGLLLLTNDGETTARLLHPSNQLPRTYRLKVKGVPDEKDVAHLRRGVVYPGGKSAPAEARLVSRLQSNCIMEMTLFEGHKREVREIMKRLGHTVLELKRIRFGPLSLGPLPPGRWRHLRAGEVAALKKVAGVKGKKGK